MNLTRTRVQHSRDHLNGLAPEDRRALNDRHRQSPHRVRTRVVVQVMATGMCRSDWHAWAGRDDIAFPHVPGHELAGVVVGVDPQVRRWQGVTG